MSTRVASILVQALIASAIAAGAGAVLAADQAPATAPTKQQREQMAALHEKMAACLRSDKDIAVCRDEMHSNCRAMMGGQDCPMMGTGMHERMMERGPAGQPQGNP
jgi:hypothetical protein